MEFTLPNDSLELGLYEYAMYPDPSSSSPSTVSISSPSSVQWIVDDFDFSCGALYPYLGFSPMMEQKFLQSDSTPLATINPQVLFAPVYAEVQEDAMLDRAPPTPELVVATPQPTPAAVAPVFIPETTEPYEGFNAPIPAEPIPMKKDRQRGSANLLRSAKDPERKHQCTMCIRKFKRRADLARHLKRHQGIRQYQCVAQSCPLDPGERFFFRADARERHWKSHPQCKIEFQMTDAGADWIKKNRNRSQKFRASHRRMTSRDTSMGSASGPEYDDDDDDADYHD